MAEAEVVTDRVYGRDLTVGAVIELGEYEMTKADLVGFAEQWDPQDFHVDDEAAAAGAYGQLIASGVQSIAVLQRLSVLGAYRYWAVIAGKSMTDVEFLRPVRVGEVLSGSLTVTGVEFDDRNRALVTVIGALSVAGKPVLRVSLSSYLWASPGS